MPWLVLWPWDLAALRLGIPGPCDPAAEKRVKNARGIQRVQGPSVRYVLLAGLRRHTLHTPVNHGLENVHSLRSLYIPIK